MNLYAPENEEIRAIAMRAELRNSHPAARDRLVDKFDHPPTDWDERTILTVPGIVWSVSSDTCMTGRQSAPDNIAYDDYGREFVFRQPSSEAELAAIMSAESEESFGCYRFDGLSRWTSGAVRAWLDDVEVVLGYLRHTLGTTEPGVEIAPSLRQYEAYLTGPDLWPYVTELQRHLGHLESGPDPAI